MSDTIGETAFCHNILIACRINNFTSLWDDAETELYSQLKADFPKEALEVSIGSGFMAIID